MAMKLATAYVEVTTKDDQFNKGIDDMKGKVEGGIASLAKAMGGFAALTGAALGGKALLDAAAVQEDAEAKLEAVLKATGHAAGLTSDELKKVAIQLQETTRFGDETTLSAMAVLATFKEIKGDQFVDAIKSMQDMNAVLGGDLNSSAVQLGKALNDPVRGITALSRVGVSFSVEQKKQIKQFMDANQIMKAQQVILDELAGEFGGTAAAAAKTLGGQMEQLHNRLGDVKERLGQAIRPIWEVWAGAESVVINLVNAVLDFDNTTGNAITSVALLTTGITLATVAVYAFKASWDLLGMTMRKVLILSGFGAVIVAIAAATYGVYKLIAAIASSEAVTTAWAANVEKFGLAWERIKTATVNVWEAIKTAVGNALAAIAEMFGFTWGEAQAGTEGFVAGAIQAVADFVMDTAQWLQVFSENWGTTWEIVKNGALVAFMFVKDLFTTNLTTVIGYGIGLIAGLVYDLIAKVWELTVSIATRIGEFMKATFTALWEGIKALFRGENFVDVFRGALDAMQKEGNDFIQAFQDGVNREPIKWEQSLGMKKALAEQKRLFDTLAERKRQLEQEDTAALMPKPGTAPEGPKTPKGPEIPKTIGLKFEAGFQGFDALQKSIQEQVLKQETGEDKLVKQGDAAALQRDEQTRLLKDMNDKLSTTGATASK